jgi:hypothetical protein
MVKIRAALVLLALLPAACGEAPAPAPGGPQPPAGAAEEPARQAGDLFGEWQVEAFESPRRTADQRKMGDPRQIAVLIGVGTIEAASQCMPYLFEYRRDGERIQVDSKGWPEAVCARMPYAFEGAFGGVVASAERIEGTASGGLRLSGPAGSVTLRRPQGGMLANPFGNSPAPGNRLLWGRFRLVEAGGVAPPPDQPIELAVGRFWIEARSGCHPFRWKKVRSDENLTLERAIWPGPVCAKAFSPAEAALHRIMPTVRRWEWIGPHLFRFTGPSGSVTILRLPSDG